MVTLIFWQNIVSPHQLPYIKKLGDLSKAIKVILVVEKNMSVHRQNMGWQAQDVDGDDIFEIITSPNDKSIKQLFYNYPTAIHFFSGIRSNKMVHLALKESLKYKIQRNLIVEGPSYYKRPKFLHLIKTFIFEQKYFSKINNIYAIGEDAQKWYYTWGFKRNSIIPFSYCVEKIKLEKQISHSQSPCLNLVFVGSLINLKGLQELFVTLEKIPRKINFDIIGEGKEYESLKKIVTSESNKHHVQFLGNKPNLEIRSLMNEYDCLILPSLYDGWGAVINEALMSGLFVICSENCGAKELIKQEFNGLVFSHRKKNDLYDALLYCIVNIETIRMKKQEIRDWSKCIEGESLARYFIKTLSSAEPVTPPWKNFEK